ncbi:MFS transporter [Mangrovibacterium lignilyticum]|uniref:MFS transporter n=1 Tax=Mangrovibacterium lignilyticum TaxID=2668052 RepID=UPI0013D10CCD|nr:MFS transporter [Mangrovibacterium lignilyticum]
MKKSLLTLSFGTFGLGIAEFVMMGILPNVARDFNISIPQAGHLISAYALGVCVGAPLTVLVARTLPLKKILLVLVAVYALGNLFTGFTPSYWTILFMRFVSGLPHGAFFGVGSIVAEKLADKGKSARAVALMVAGMTVANLAGVPLGTFLSNLFSWRIIFIANGVWGLLNLLAIIRWLPDLEPMPNTGLKGQFAFLKNLSPWLLIGSTALANGGIFCMYSYVTPLMTDMAGFSAADMSWIMILCGLAMVIGNIIGGRLSDKFPMHNVLSSIHAVAGLSLIAIFFFSTSPLLVLPMLIICSASLFAISSPTQLLLLRNSRGGEMMGAAFVQVAFNMGNAIGAWNGGLAIAANKGVNYTAIIGAGYLIAACSLVLFYRHWQQSNLIPNTIGNR